MIFRIFFLITLLISIQANAQNIRYGITNNEGKIIPDDIILFSEDSVPFNLKNSINKPTVLAFVYYRCPGICSSILSGIAEVVNKTTLELGADYQIIAVSIENKETPSLAKSKKQNYLQFLKNKNTGENWRFCTTDSNTISKLTNLCGFEFQKTETEIIHPAALIVLTPNGMISQYLYGSYYLPMDLEMAVKSAKEEKINAPRIKKISYCHSNKYALKKSATDFIALAEIIAIAILFATFIFMLIIKKGKITK